MDPNVENDDLPDVEGMDSFLSDLANAIPGIDEAMSFAEMLKWVFSVSLSHVMEYLVLMECFGSNLYLKESSWKMLFMIAKVLH